MTIQPSERLGAGLHRVLLGTHAVFSGVKAVLALMVLPNFLPVVAIEAAEAIAAGALAIFVSYSRYEHKDYGLLALAAIAAEVYFFYPFFLTFDLLQSAFLLATFFDMIVLVGLACAPFRVLSVPPLLMAGWTVWLLFDRIRGEPLVLVIASYVIAVLIGILFTLLVRLRREHVRLIASFRETERLNRRLATASARIMEQRRRENLATMTAGIAHEINNPITYLAGNMEFLERHVDALLRESGDNGGNVSSDLAEARAEVPEILESFRTGVDMIQRVVQRLQHTFGAESRDSSVVVLRDIVDSCLKSLGIRRDGAYTATVDVTRDITIVADPADLYTVVINVLRNAVEAGDGEGHIHVTAKVRNDVEPGEYSSIGQTDRPHLNSELSGAADGPASLSGPMVELRICDDGPGIPRSVLHRVFDPFYSDKRDHDGMGIGLALCKAIVEQLGGRIRIDSREGSFTCVYILVPKESS
ncbi:MAG: sensor histidine kinase [Spirochaetaceae bacterium]